MRVAVIIPTIAGREFDLTRCVNAYKETAPDAHRIIVRDRPSCGQAWIDGAEMAFRGGGKFDYIHFTADDLEPHQGWLETAAETVEKGYIPTPLVYHPDGALESAGLRNFGCYAGPFEDWQVMEGTTVPFLTRRMWERIGMIPVHYTSDLWVSYQGRLEGWETVVRTGMVFTHYNAPEGRDYSRVPADTNAYLEAIR